MIQLYSTNVNVDTNSSIPLNNIKLIKGTTAVHSAPASIELNRSGIYMVTVNASITPAAAGTVSIQLVKDNVVEPAAVSSATGAADSISSLSFSTLVQVRDNNTCCCNTSPTVLQLLNTGQAGVFSIVNMVITKIC